MSNMSNVGVSMWHTEHSKNCWPPSIAVAILKSTRTLAKKKSREGLELVSKLKNGQMEHKFPFGIPDRENGSTFSDVPFIWEIFRWDEPKWRVPFTAQPEFPGFFCKW